MRQGEALEELVRRANGGSESALANLRKVLDMNPELWQGVGNVAALAERAWIDLISAGNQLAVESIRRRLAETKRELAGDAASPLEQMLADLVSISWLATCQAESAAATPPGASLAQATFRLRRAESAHRRLLGAIKALTLVRTVLPRSAPALTGSAEGR